MKLIFIRHGDPDYKNDSLTDKGRREAELVAKKVREIAPDHVYSSPLGRAKLTCEYSQKECGFEYEVKDWLREFPGRMVYPPTGETRSPWDLHPSYFTGEDLLYDNARWMEHPVFDTGCVREKFAEMAEGLDSLLERHGYKKDGRIYRAVRPNRDTVVLFCHFGVTAAMISHITGFSPYLFWQHFCALTTSVTTLVTEEREDGIAVFRCIGFGEVGHLTEHGEPPSFAARFCETYDSDERH